MKTNVLLACDESGQEARVRAALDAVHGRPYELRTVATLADTLAAVRAGQVDAVLLDLKLTSFSPNLVLKLGTPVITK